MPIRLLQVDAFTAEPFGGNPAAVCLLPGAREATWMQRVAREMNLSETAFLVAGDRVHHLRWFTPTAERSYGVKLVFKAANNPRSTILSVKGAGRELKCLVSPASLELPAVLPYAEPVGAPSWETPAANTNTDTDTNTNTGTNTDTSLKCTGCTRLRASGCLPAQRARIVSFCSCA